jgi:hypothetical protein
VIAIKKKMINAKNPSAWKGNAETELNLVFEVNKETMGFTFPSV